MCKCYWTIVLLTLLVVFFCKPAKCQPDYYEARQRVHVIEQGSTIEAGITNSELSNPKRWRVYFSYYFDAIHQVQGAYVGRLLHGSYLEFSYPGDKLRSKGEFKKGLKHGEWTCWYPNGMIQELEHWHKGVLRGKVRHYTPDGKRLKIPKAKTAKIKKTSKSDSTKTRFKLPTAKDLRQSLKLSRKNAQKKTK